MDEVQACGSGGGHALHTEGMSSLIPREGVQRICVENKKWYHLVGWSAEAVRGAWGMIG